MGGGIPIIGSLFGGGKKPAPTQVIKQVAPEPRNQDVDPNKSSQVADARKRRVALSKRTGRSALRVDLSNSSKQTRSGISIN